MRHQVIALLQTQSTTDTPLSITLTPRTLHSRPIPRTPLTTPRAPHTTPHTTPCLCCLPFSALLPPTLDSAEDLDQEVAALLTHITDYQPRELVLPARLRCFIPDFVPAIGYPDPFVKVGCHGWVGWLQGDPSYRIRQTHPVSSVYLMWKHARALTLAHIHTPGDVSPENLWSWAPSPSGQSQL